MLQATLLREKRNLISQRGVACEISKHYSVGGGVSYLQQGLISYSLELLNGYREMPSKPYAVCVTNFTMHVHLHGAVFVSFLLLTGRCCDAETSVILVLLDRAFAS